MKTYKDETGKTVKANNFKAAANKMYGVEKDINGQNATYAYRHHNYADIKIYKNGDKVGTYYGVQAATPITHRLEII